MVDIDEDTKEEKISRIGLYSFFVTITSSGFLSMGAYIIFSLSNINAYISAILGTIFSIIPFFMYRFISKNSRDKDIIDLNISLFGKKIGIILNLMLNATIFFISILSLYNISQFVDIQFMPETESIYLKILILIPIAYAASKSIKTISKVSQIFMFFKLAFIFITVIGVLKSIDISFIFPIMKDGLKGPLIGSFIYTIFATYPVFLLTIIPQSSVEKETQKNSKSFIMFLLANVIIIIRFILVVTILGEDIIPMIRYPEYIILKKFQLFSLVERVENILALYFVFNNIMYQIISFYFLITSFKKIKFLNKIKTLSHMKVLNKVGVNNKLSYILAGIILFFATQIFKNTAQAADIIKNYVPYIIIIGIFIPMFSTCLLMFLKSRVSFVKNKK